MATAASATASTLTLSSPIFSVNPYENHPSLTQLEADVLWEYAKLNQHIKDVRHFHPRPLGYSLTPLEPPVIKFCLQSLAQTRILSESPDEAMLQRLRVLERKMGLVLTLVR
jgi:DASH complex subunit DAD3